jgi:uncharacterized protein YkwD
LLRTRIFLPLLTIATVALGAIALTTTVASAADVSQPMPVLDAEEKAFVGIINNYRAQNGLGPLQVSIKLTQSSAWMSDDLSKRPASGFGHTDTQGRDATPRMKAFGYDYNTYTGENIAAGTNSGSAPVIFEQWRNSPGHNANMLGKNYVTMGIARVYRAGSPYSWYWTNDFGGFDDARVTDAAAAPAAPEPPPAPPLAIPAVRSAMVAVPPTRILDTRTTGSIPANGSVTIRMPGQKGVVPTSGVTAVTLTVTITDAKGAGFVTVYPGGGGRPEASNLNVSGPGRTVANLVTVPLGPSGEVVLYTSGGGHLIADVAGYYTQVGGTARGGRFQPIAPSRLVDTRNGNPVPPKSSAVIKVTGRPGIPASGVSAVSLNLTVTDAIRSGFLTAYPASSGVPTVSNLNINNAGDTVAGAAIVPVDANGNIGVYLDGGGDLLVDINGWFTDGNAGASSEGLFVAQTPTRTLDSRKSGSMAGKSTLDLGVPSGSIAVSANLTLTDTSGAGFLSAWATGGARPTVSSVNAVGRGQTVANHAIIPTSGGARFFADMTTNLIVDYDGYYLPANV